MDIERLEIGRFGCLRDLQVDDLGPGVHVFHGTNETGKTTLLEFVRGMLFGFGSLVRRGVIDFDVESVGRLAVRPVANGRLWTVIRRRAAGVPLLGKNAHDDLVVVDDAGRQHVRSSLEEWTGGLDEASYVAVMAFGLDELHELSSLQAAGCGGRLYELAGGLDRGHVFRVMENLRAAITRADSGDPTTSPIAALERRLNGLRDRFLAAGSPAVTRGRQLADARRLRSEVAALEPRLAAATEEEERLLAAMDLEPIVREHEAAVKALRCFDPDTLVHPDFHRWRRLDKRRRRVRRSLEARRDARRQMAVEGRQLPKPSSVWQKRRLIRPLLDDEPRLERLTAEAARAETAALLAARKFGEELGSLGLSRLVDDDTAASHRGSLLPPGFATAFRAMRPRATACATASRDVRDAATELEAITQEIAAADDGRSADRAAASQQLAERLEQAATMESLIRKRLTTGSQLEDVQRSIERMEDDVRLRLEGHVLPSGILTTLGTAFSIGIGLLFSGLLLPADVTGSMGYAMAAVGLAGAGVAGATTWSLDRSAAGRVATARSQLATAHRQRQAILGTLSDLDARLETDHPESLEARLVAARSEVTRLEQQAAELANLSDPHERFAAAEARFEQARRARNRARGRWKRALEARGFPGSLTPRTFRELARHRRHLEMLDEERRHAVEDARGMRADLTTVALPIEQTVAALDIENAGLAPVELLEMLRERLAADQSIVRRRRRVRRAFRKARHGHRLAVRQMKSIEAKLADLLRRHDVESEDAFLELVDRRQAYDAAGERVAASTATVEEARRLLPPESLAQIDTWLTEAADHPLEQRARHASQQRDRLASSLRDLSERLAGLTAVCDASRNDRNLEPLQVEAAEIEEELSHHRRRRVAQQTALELLTETRRRFLAEHQPPVLLEASTWLERLTGGRYRHITAVADDAVLLIEDRDGVRWTPERLSRGTREQVFLALRLALVADLERAGIRLPLIMDDALVNFDDERAQFAAQTLVEFASERGRQMLVLSCHAHVVQLFTQAGAHIRGLDGGWLSSRQLPAGAAVRQPPPTPRDELPLQEEVATEPPMAEEIPQPPTLPQPVAAACWSAPPVGEFRAVAGPGDGIPELPEQLARARQAAVKQSPASDKPRMTMASRPVKTFFVARHTWSAEEFDGELDDLVAVHRLARRPEPATEPAVRVEQQR